MLMLAIKIFMLKFALWQKKIHDEQECNDADCALKNFLEDLEKLIDEMTSEEPNFHDRLSFIEISTKYLQYFLMCDQFVKKYGTEFFHMDKEQFELAVYYEMEKVSSFLKNLELIKKLQARQYVLEKTFSYFFLIKK